MNLNETTIAYIKKMFGLDTLAFLDYETFYKSKANNGTKSFSIKSKTYAEYILDPQGRFHVTGLGVAEDMSPVEYVHEADEVQALIDEYKARREQGERIGVVAHNVQFDASVSNWTQRLNWDAYFCTKMMRTLLHSDRSSSLKAACLDMWPNDESLNKGGEELADVDALEPKHPLFPYHLFFPLRHRLHRQIPHRSLPPLSTRQFNPQPYLPNYLPHALHLFPTHRQKTSSVVETTTSAPI